MLQRGHTRCGDFKVISNLEEINFHSLILIEVNRKRVAVERSDKKEGIIDYLFKKSGSEGKRWDRIIEED